MAKKGQGKYNNYTTEERAKMGKCAAENSTTCSYKILVPNVRALVMFALQLILFSPT